MQSSPALHALDQPEQASAFFREHGYVVFRDVLSEEECLATQEDVGRLMRLENPAFDLFDASTYADAPLNPNYGVVGREPIFSHRFLLNRQHPNLHRAFALLLGEDDLLVSHDRCAFYRPTRNVPLPGGAVDRPDWRTEHTYPGVHLDFNPASYRRPERVVAARDALDYSDRQHWITENNLYCAGDGLQLQAVLNLEDNRDEDGGFHCVPGFHLRFEEWLEGFASDDDSPSGLYRFSARSPNDCRYIHTPVRVPVRAGALIVWDQRLAHGTLPNASARGRLIQFVKAFPRRIVSRERGRARARALAAILESVDFRQVTDVGRTVFGLDAS